MPWVHAPLAPSPLDRSVDINIEIEAASSKSTTHGRRMRRRCLTRD